MARALVLGGGPGGSQPRRDLVTFQPMSLPAAGPDASAALAALLGERDVGVGYRLVVSCADATRGQLSFESGQDLDYSVLLGVPAEQAPPVVRDSVLAGPSGFVEPDRSSLRTAFDGVYAVGDCTAVPTAIGSCRSPGCSPPPRESWPPGTSPTSCTARPRRRSTARGACFLEVPGRRVGTVEGDFFAEPRPEVRLTEATEANFELKQRYEIDRLAEWLG